MENTTVPAYSPGSRGDGGDEEGAGGDREQRRGGGAHRAEPVRDPGAEDPDHQDGEAVDEEVRPGVLEAEVVEEDGQERAERREAHEAQQEDGPRHDRRRVQQSPSCLRRWSGSGSWRPRSAGISRDTSDATAGEHGGDEPDPAGAGRPVEHLAEERSDGEAAVDRDGEERGRLAPAVVRAQVLGGGGGADEERPSPRPVSSRNPTRIGSDSTSP